MEAHQTWHPPVLYCTRRRAISQCWSECTSTWFFPFLPFQSPSCWFVRVAKTPATPREEEKERERERGFPSSVSLVPSCQSDQEVCVPAQPALCAPACLSAAILSLAPRSISPVAAAAAAACRRLHKQSVWGREAAHAHRAPVLLPPSGPPKGGGARDGRTRTMEVGWRSSGSKRYGGWLQAGPGRGREREGGSNARRRKTQDCDVVTRW